VARGTYKPELADFYSAPWPTFAPPLTAEDRLTNEAGQFVADVPATPTIAEDGRGEIRETENVVQVAIGEQATVRWDAGAAKFELDPAVEAGPQNRVFAFTLRVLHLTPAPSPLSC
jgi:hypothetical protein